MAGKIQCFFLQPSIYAQETLRRYSHDGTCSESGRSYHNAEVVIGTVPYPLSDLDGEPGKGIERNDPRWPTTCPCGYAFNEGDQWQHQLTRVFWRGDHAAMRTTLAEAPIGSMYFADWYPWKGPDGHCLVVVTPAGPWIVDGPSTNSDGSKGSPWSRVGKVPEVTANPSINFPGRFHGWLRAGVLEEC